MGRFLAGFGKEKPKKKNKEKPSKTTRVYILLCFATRVYFQPAIYTVFYVESDGALRFIQILQPSEKN